MYPSGQQPLFVWRARLMHAIASFLLALPQSRRSVPGPRRNAQAILRKVGYSLREWLLVPAYQQATAGNYALIRELQEVMTQPYAEQSKDVEGKYYRMKPSEFFEVGGLSYYSCSS